MKACLTLLLLMALWGCGKPHQPSLMSMPGSQNTGINLQVDDTRYVLNTVWIVCAIPKGDCPEEIVTIFNYGDAANKDKFEMRSRTPAGYQRGYYKSWNDAYAAGLALHPECERNAQ